MIRDEHIRQWHHLAPWTHWGHVEQDLVICRAIVEIFSDPFLAQELLRQACGGELDYYNAATGSEKNLRLIHDKDGNRGFVKVNHTPIYD